ncbi:uracil-DNA glycosylase [Halosquirtibacter xylanolyticus]|uniref:uracil-DNA glycosylase n=1 Tax=Halosquirtibacter xylanolyticus TaxID=3374599 RepID=UPI003747D78B|nr:uracil-DNA glycosylase [Prolixibacteraceae bacterium]
MDVKIETSWKEALKSEFAQPYFKTLTDFVKEAYRTKTIYPPAKHVFEAFHLTPLTQVKVVILGQDPYHGANQAHGLCFSVNEGIALPPSLRNIFKVRELDVNVPYTTNGNLTAWAEQGVFLLNATLTVEASKAGSHQKKGWETFTDTVIKTISEKQENVVFILWGAYAQKKQVLIDQNKHLILQSVHPSPLSAHRGFFETKPFSDTNSYLKSKGITPIQW